MPRESAGRGTGTAAGCVSRMCGIGQPRSSQAPGSLERTAVLMGGGHWQSAGQALVAQTMAVSEDVHGESEGGHLAHTRAGRRDRDASTGVYMRARPSCSQCGTSSELPCRSRSDAPCGDVARFPWAPTVLRSDMGSPSSGQIARTNSGTLGVIYRTTDPKPQTSGAPSLDSASERLLAAPRRDSR